MRKGEHLAIHIHTKTNPLHLHTILKQPLHHTYSNSRSIFTQYSNNRFITQYSYSRSIFTQYSNSRFIFTQHPNSRFILTQYSINRSLPDNPHKTYHHTLQPHNHISLNNSHQNQHTIAKRYTTTQTHTAEPPTVANPPKLLQRLQQARLLHTTGQNSREPDPSRISYAPDMTPTTLHTPLPKTTTSHPPQQCHPHTS
jgi:hypothetical protein